VRPQRFEHHRRRKRRFTGGHDRLAVEVVHDLGNADVVAVRDGQLQHRIQAGHANLRPVLRRGHADLRGRVIHRNLDDALLHRLIGCDDGQPQAVQPFQPGRIPPAEQRAARRDVDALADLRPVGGVQARPIGELVVLEIGQRGIAAHIHRAAHVSQRIRLQDGHRPQDRRQAHDIILLRRPLDALGGGPGLRFRRIVEVYPLLHQIAGGAGRGPPPILAVNLHQLVVGVLAHRLGALSEQLGHDRAVLRRQQAAHSADLLFDDGGWPRPVGYRQAVALHRVAQDRVPDRRRAVGGVQADRRATIHVAQPHAHAALRRVAHRPQIAAIGRQPGIDARRPADVKHVGRAVHAGA